MESLLIISIIGVWGNLILQTGWFIWSYSVHRRKHFTDTASEDSREIDFHDRIEEYLELRIHNEQIIKDRDLLWKEFTPQAPAPSFTPSFTHPDLYGDKMPFRTDWTCDTVFNTTGDTTGDTTADTAITGLRTQFEPKRGPDGKFRPEDIAGDLDSFFDSKEPEDTKDTKDTNEHN